MAKVELKQPIVDEIKGLFDGAKGAVLVDYRGLTVEQDTRLRKQLREAGVIYKGYKNTLIRRAAEGTEFAALDPHLEGPTALAVSKEDATAPARVLANFAKTADKLELKGSVVEGTYYDAKGTQVIASIPSREELQSPVFPWHRSRCQGNTGDCVHSFQRGAAGQTLWQHAVPHRQLCPRYQPDRGVQGRRSRGISFRRIA